MYQRVLGSIIRLHNDEAGQGLVEYLLVVGIIAFAAIAAMGTFANTINAAFGILNNKLGLYVS